MTLDRVFAGVLKAAVAAAACLHISTHVQAASPPLGVEDVLTMRTFRQYAPIMLSADGREVAYILKRSRSERHVAPGAAAVQYADVPVDQTDVWLTDTQTGESRNISEGQGSSRGTAWSPDGQLLAFYSDRDGVARLWVWDRQTQSLRRVSDTPIYPSYDASELQWTPDGRQVLVSVPAEQATADNDAGTAVPVTRSQSTHGAQGRPTVRVFSSGLPTDPPAQRAPGRMIRYDLALIEASSGQVRRIAGGVSAFAAQISPNGKFVAIMNQSGAKVPGSATSLLDLKLVPLAGGEPRTLVSGIRMGGNNIDKNDWSWSPDSQWLAYRDTTVKNEAYDASSWTSQAFLVSLQGKIRPLTAQSQPKFRGTPVWDDQGRFLYFFTAEEVWHISTSDGHARVLARLPGKTLKTLVTASPNRDRLWTTDGGRCIVVAAETESKDGLKMGFYRIWLDSGKVSPLFEEEKRYVVDNYNIFDNLLASQRTQQIVYVAEDAQRPKDLWQLSGELRQPRQLSHLNPSIDAIPRGQQRRIDWIGRDGTAHAGFLLLPSDYREGQRYPLVAYVYAMTPTQFANYFGYMAGATEGHFLNMQLLATRGYAVLLAGAPTRRGEPMKWIADWALPGIDKAVESGVVDADRVGVFGSSAGGYAVLSLIVQSTRFKAAVEQAGPGNLLSWYGAGLKATGYSHGEFNAENGFGMAGHPWEAREQYIRNSPWFFLDKVTTPLLILQGTEDDATSPSQANEIFVGLRRLGKEVQYALYDGEGHGFNSLANQIDAVNRYIDWFDSHLKAASE